MQLSSTRFLTLNQRQLRVSSIHHLHLNKLAQWISKQFRSDSAITSLYSYVRFLSLPIYSVKIMLRVWSKDISCTRASTIIYRTSADYSANNPKEVTAKIDRATKYILHGVLSVYYYEALQ